MLTVNLVLIMDNKSVTEIKEDIRLKKQRDKKKLIRLTKIAAYTTMIRVIIYLLPGEHSGLLVEIFWLPLIALILSLPFYGFEKLLDKIKND